MSSLKKYLPQKTYKERAQPKRRARFGLLEKHKDYVQRARNYHKKERRYKALVEKALQRNPDEFYFKMINSRTENGIHVELAPAHGGISEEESRVQLNRICSYIFTQINHERSRIEALQSELHFTEVPRNNKHILYVDDTEPEEGDQSINEHIVTSPLSNFSSWTKGSLKKTETALSRKYAELRWRLDREKKLRKLLQNLESRKSSGKSSKQQVGQDSMNSVVRGASWRRERSR
ncbi:hypothetical protein GAYE_SCF02G2191 [Galdieria yellowstonensis]|uniref:U3 small nucleolar RNA-associated protein 11 n=1 Tax=Galdieria yellowstonensis TaxID=3028027 RepID=A0AAV9IA74_9RHOD|nr:hypothetical protein GAYE_SCF02G2191 [Galdieria yellowstonensis]